MTAPERIFVAPAWAETFTTQSHPVEAEYIALGGDELAAMLAAAEARGAAREREACAKVAHDWQNETGTDIASSARICPQIAAAIRARGGEE